MPRTLHPHRVRLTSSVTLDFHTSTRVRRPAADLRSRQFRPVLNEYLMRYNRIGPTAPSPHDSWQMTPHRGMRGMTGCRLGNDRDVLVGLRGDQIPDCPARVSHGNQEPIARNRARSVERYAKGCRNYPGPDLHR